jgi:hypothetical protein
MKRLLFLVPFAALAMALLVRAEPAVTIRAVELKATPAADARTVVALPTNSTVDVLTRQGAWVQVKSGNSTGWTKLFDVRAAATGTPAKSGSSGNAMAETLGLATGARGSTVTTGVRGLDADMLSRAVPNAQEYATFESYAVTKDQATVFARAGRLEPRTVEDGVARIACGRPSRGVR